ncbi:MAG: hypothetical protein SGBAC_004488 [Bacillariaceae sp.]
MLQTGLKQKLQVGSSKLFHHKFGNGNQGGHIDESNRSHIDASRRSHIDASKRSGAADEKKVFSTKQVVWYSSKGKKPKKATILSIDRGPNGEPFYTIQFLKSGTEKQTDDAHLEQLGPDDAAEGNSQACFKTDQIVFHKPGDGAPVYLAQVTRVYQDDGRPLYDIRLQGSNVDKSSIQQSELFDMNEAPGVGCNAPAQSPSTTSRKSSRRSRSPKRGIKKVLSSEGLKEIKRGVKKVSSMDALDQMKKAVQRSKSGERSVKPSPVRGVPSKTKSGCSSADGSSEMPKPSSSRSLLSAEKRPRFARVKTRSMEGLKEMMQAGKQSLHLDDGHLTMKGKQEGVRTRRTKSRSMEGLRDMRQGPQHSRPQSMRKPPAPNHSMMSSSNHSGHRSVRSHRPQPRNQAEKEKLDRQRGVQRSKSLEGMHPRHLRRPTSRERLGPPVMPTRGVNENHSWHKEHGDAPRPPVRTPSGAQRRGGPALQNARGQAPPVSHIHGKRSAGNKALPARSRSNASKNARVRNRSNSSQKQATQIPPIRAMKKAEYDSDDSEESSISSVSWQEPKPSSFNRSRVPLPKKEAPKPTEITVDMDDASSVSSGDDSSWESFREHAKFKPGNLQRQWQQKREEHLKIPKVKKVTHDTEITGFDSIVGVEVRVQNVYSSDEESESSEELDFEPQDLFDWAD